ncbi:MAG: ATP-binding cassette domain-containing protein [Anaerolineae bacterium]
MAELILDMRGITKTFPGVRALDNVHFSCERGEVHALVGENGAGKSTLMKILSGVYSPDAGEIIFKGSPVRMESPHHAQSLGISTIYQEPSLLPYLTVAENIYLGREITGRLGLVDARELQRRAQALLDRLGAAVDVSSPVFRLGVAQQQLVEIAKALSLNADLIIMDEPTAALGEREVAHLFEVIRSLRQDGVTVIYVSHRLDEIFRIADRATVLKDGQVVGTVRTADVSKGDLICMMVGRPLSEAFPPRGDGRGEKVLEVRGLTRRGAFYDIHFSLHRGEILGIAGLAGSGRTEIVRALFGADPVDAGEVLLHGKPLQIRGPRDAVNSGIGFLTEDRKAEGLVMGLSVRENVALPSLDVWSAWGLVDRARERKVVGDLIAELQIRPPNPQQQVQYLSGGNQQKVVLAKWLATEPDVLLFDEPTLGIDVGAKVEIYALMRRLANEGKAIIMISSELPEVIGMSDRILVLCEGRIVGELTPEEATEERILALACGLEAEAKPREAEACPLPGSDGSGTRPEDGREGFLQPLARFVRTNPHVATVAVYAILVGLVAFGLSASPAFRTPRNWVNLLRQATSLGLVSIGQTFVILAGGFDVSVSAVITLVSLLSAVLMEGGETMVLPAVLLSLALGVLYGLGNGLAIVRLRVNPFIATFATMSIGRGIALAYTKIPVGRTTPSYRFLSDGFIGPFPVPLILFALALGVSLVVLRRTRFGRHVYAVGGDPEIARWSGIPVSRIRIATYVLSGLMAAVTGLYLASRMGVGDPAVGPGMEWDSVTAVVVGGTSLAGGRGGLAGTLAGVLLLTVISNILNLLNVHTWYQQILKGLIILFAVAVYKQTK